MPTALEAALSEGREKVKDVSVERRERQELVIYDCHAFASGLVIGFGLMMVGCFDSNKTAALVEGRGTSRVEIVATHKNRFLVGTVADERFIGTEFLDTIEGNGGDDEYYAGRGRDVIVGGDGNDTYYFSVGDGVDLVKDNGGNADQIVIRGSVSWTDLVITENSGGLDIRVGVEASGDHILISNWGLRNNFIEHLFVDDKKYSIDQIEEAIIGNRRPKATMKLEDAIAVVGEPFRFDIPDGAFVDPDAGDILTYNEYLPGGKQLPSWLAFSTDNGSFSGIPSSIDIGEIHLELRAQDSGLRLAISPLTIQVVLRD